MDPRERNRQYPIIEEVPPVEAPFSHEEKSFVARWNGLTYKDLQRRVDFFEAGKDYLVSKAYLAQGKVVHCNENQDIGEAAAKAVGLL